MTQIAVIENLKKELWAREPELNVSLPDNIDPKKFISVALTSIQNNPDLLRANRVSLLNSCLRCAQDGLLPDGREAAFVMFKNQAVYMPMVTGVLKRIRNAGRLKTIYSQIIYENDDFDFFTDEHGEHVTYKPKLFDESRGKIKGIFAVANFDGGVFVEVMSLKEIEKVRKVSRSSNNGPWRDWWEEMAKKTVIRRLAKRLPLSSEAQSVVDADNHFYDLQNEETPQIKTVEDAEKESQECETNGNKEKEAPQSSSEKEEVTAPQEKKKSEPKTKSKTSKKSSVTKKSKKEESESKPTSQETTSEKSETTDPIEEKRKWQKEIWTVAEKLGWNGAKIGQWISDNFGKSGQELTLDELQEACNIMYELAYPEENKK